MALIVRPAVFLRSVISRGHEYVLLVQTYRDEGTVRQKVVRYFGRRDHLDMEHVRAFVRNLEAGRSAVRGRVGPRRPVSDSARS